MQRYYRWYASRTRGARRRQASDAAEAPVWAELLRRIFEVDPLTPP